MRTAVQGWRSASAQQQGPYLSLCVGMNQRSAARVLQNDLQQGNDGHVSEPESVKVTRGTDLSCGACAHRQATCSSIDIYERTSKWEYPLLEPVLFTDGNWFTHVTSLEVFMRS